MSASRTFAVLKATAMAVGEKFGFQRGEIIRQNMDQAAYCGLQVDLGGSETEGILSAAFEAVPGAREFSLNGDTLGGLTLEAVVTRYTTNAATTVQARLRNTNDSSNAALGSASASTTPVIETLTATIASGVKTYRLEVTGSDALYPVAAYGYLRFRKVAA